MSKLAETFWERWQGTKAENYTATGLTRDDTEAMEVLHAESFARPWTGGEFARLLDESDLLAIGLRRREDAAPVAFVLIRMVPVAGESEVLTIAVAKAKQRRGLGFKLLDEALRRLKTDGLESLFLEVDEANVSARKLYDRLGFEVVGERAGYYPASDETQSARSNALVMKLGLG